MSAQETQEFSGDERAKEAIRRFEAEAVDFASTFTGDDTAQLDSLLRAKRFLQEMTSIADDVG